MKKVLIVLGLLGALGLFTCIGAPVLLVLLRGPRERPVPVAGQAMFEAANRQIGSHKGREAFGNNTEATRLAQEFSTSLRAGREVFFTEDKKRAVSLTDDHFLTYCQLDDDSVAFICHVPDLRKFEGSAKKELAKLAWMTAQGVIDGSSVEPTDQLAVGLRGAMVYSDILIGKVSDEPPAPAAGMREVLYPFFDDGTAVTPALSSAPVAPAP